MQRATHSLAVSRPRRNASLLPVLAIACWFGTVGFASQPLGHRSFDPQPFSRVVLDLPANFKLRQSKNNYIGLTGESSVLAKIGLSVAGDTLTVVAASAFSTQQPLEVDIGFTQLAFLEVRSASDVTVESLQGPALDLVVSGSADVALNRVNLGSLTLDSTGSATVTVVGQGATQSIHLEGSGDFQGEGFQTNEATVRLGGAADAIVWATKRLNATVSGSGTVRYRGNPIVTPKLSGTGSVDPL